MGPGFHQVRNHNYVLDIFGIPWEGLGYASFDDAVNSVTYANNQTVTISETVPTVNDGRYQLSIIGDTYLIYQDPALVNTTQTIYFEYKAMVSGESTSGVTADSFKAAWNYRASNVGLFVKIKYFGPAVALEY